MRFAIYSRKSVYTGKGNSIENQIAMCKEHIFHKYPGTLEKDITIYEDEGFSGKNTARPQFQQLLADLKQNQFDALVCYKLDRVSRNVIDFSTLIEDLNKMKISFISIKEESFDTTTIAGKLMITIVAAFAQFERETIAERVRDNMLMLARSGRWLGGTTPTGYISEQTSEIFIEEAHDKPRQLCKLKEDAGEIKIIDLIFTKFLELRSISGVSKVLIKQGIKSRNGKTFSLPGIKDILQNPVYCIADKDAYDYFMHNNADICFDEQSCNDKFGLISYNKRDYRKKGAKRLSIDKWIIAIGKHKGRISGQKWVAAQNILKENMPDGKKPAVIHNDYSLLSGMLFCSKCGNRIFAKPRHGRASKQYDYICKNKLLGGVNFCDCPNLPGQETDDSVCEHVMQYAGIDSDIFIKLDKLKTDMGKEAVVNPFVLIAGQIKKKKDEKNNLLTSVSNGNLGESFIQSVSDKLTEIDKELDYLNSEYLKLKAEAAPVNRQIADIQLTLQMISDFKSNYKTFSINEKRAILKILINKIVWDGDNIHIFIYGK